MAKLPEFLIVKKTAESKTEVTYEIAKPVTNADRIRQMSDRELAEFMCHNVSNGTVNCAFCAAEEFCRFGHIGWIEWLKQECE